MEVIDWIKDFGSIVGILVTIVGAITGIVKPLRLRFIAWIRKTVFTDEQVKNMQNLQNEQSKNMQELSNHIKSLSDAVSAMTSRSDSYDAEISKKLGELIDLYGQLQQGSYYTLGNVIREVYHENKEAKRLSEHDYDLCQKVYNLYHDLWHQNGPIQAMWDEMVKWEKDFD